MSTRRQFVKKTGAGVAGVLAAGAALGAVAGTASGEAAGAAGSAAGTAAGPAAGAAKGSAGSQVDPPFALGMTSYTFREFDLETTLAWTARMGLEFISLKSMHLPLDTPPAGIEAVARQVREAGLDLYGCGVVYMTSEAEVENAFAYAAAGGMRIIIGVPEHDLLPLVERKVAEYDIKLAIHNHGPGDERYPTPQSAFELVREMDPRLGLCVDIGHTMRSGVDPSEPMRLYADRVHDLHIKDVSAADRSGSTVEIGRGVIDIPRFVRTVLDTGFSGVLALEHEKDGNDPLAGAAEAIGFVRGVLATLP